MNIFKLLISLLVCHFLADYCLTTPQMIAAKASGKKLQHVALHALVHAALMGAVLLAFCVSCVVGLFALELVTHFVIDYGKGFLGRKFPAFADNTKKLFWMLYGLDQLLHLLVIVVIVYFAVS